MLKKELLKMKNNEARAIRSNNKTFRYFIISFLKRKSEKRLKEESM